MSARLIAAAAANIDEGAYDPPVPHVALVREAIATLAWGTMNYRCEACGFEWEVWLGLGVEGPAGLRDHGLYVASPFTISRCPAWPIKQDATPEERAQLRHMVPCDGRMTHVRFCADREFGPTLVPDDAPRFVLDAWDVAAQLVIPTPALVRARQFHTDRA